MNHRIKFLLCLLTFPAVLTLGAAEPAAPWMSFKQWNDACKSLPPNRSLLGKFPDNSLLPLKSFSELERAIDAFIHVSTNAPLGTLENWVGEQPEPEVFFNTSRAWFLRPPIPFQPFAKKLLLPAGSKVVIQGDLHGDIRSLLVVLNQLNERNWLDGFRIIDPDLHLCFLGDYTDRGAYGAEVLYTLLRLKIANPDRVHFARGNHEDLDLVARYGFFAELQSKFGRDINVAKLLRAYDFLPVVIYLGNGTNVAQLNHGGMEPGYSPSALLDSSGTNRFQFLGRLHQQTYLTGHPDWLATNPASLQTAASKFQDFTPMSPTVPSVIGFMWNDYTVFSSEPPLEFDPGRAFVYGRSAVEQLLKTASTTNTVVRAVFRAHQHSGISNPMMRRLVASDGVFRHWQTRDNESLADTGPAELRSVVETSTTRSIPEGSVWTFNVAPDSVYGVGCGFTFVTYGVLSLAPGFNDWRLEVVRLAVE